MASHRVIPFATSILFLSAALAPGAEEAQFDARAADLFARDCAVCHGADGRARGAIAALLRPRPRDFGEGLFQLASSDNGVPTRGDLARVIENGVAGSGMPSFRWVAPQDRDRLADHVVRLAIAGIADRLVEEAGARGESLDPALAREAAHRRMSPAGVALFPNFPDPTPEVLARGKDLFIRYCAACHGADARGRAPLADWSDREYPTVRDLTRGPWKGGTSLEDLARRIRAGMPGRLMPPTPLPLGELGALSVFVRSLIPADADLRWRQGPIEVVARRVAALPIDERAPEWDATAEGRLVLSPFSGRADAILEANVAALHDGNEVAIRLRWTDPTADDRAASRSRLPDGAALQFTAESDPPLFGMGSLDHPVNLWHWSAFHPDRLAGLFDLLEPGSAAEPGPVTDVPRARVPGGLVSPEREGASVEATGPGHAFHAFEGAKSIAVAARHADGAWTVVLRRALAARDAGEIGLAPASRVSFAVAIWNGSAGDAGGRKSISIWNGLSIE